MPAIVYAEPVAIQHLREVAAAAAHCPNVTWTEGLAVTFLQLASISLFVGAIILFIKAAASSTLPESRKFYYPLILACAVGGCCYFAMSQDQGWVISHGCRQTFYSHFIDMIVSLPLVVLSLGLIAEASPADVAGAMGYTALMSASLLFGALSYVLASRWIWFLFSLLWLFAASHQILFCFVPYMADGSSPVSRLSSLVVTCLCLYPFLWMLSEGFHIFSIGLEVFSFATVDIVIRAVLGVLVMVSSVHTHYSSATTGSAFSSTSH